MLSYVWSLGSPLSRSLISRYTLCTTDPSSNVKEESHKVLAQHKTILRRLLIIVCECICKQPNAIPKNVLSLAPVRSVSFQVRFLSSIFLRVVSTSCFLVLREDGNRVGQSKPSHTLVSTSIRKLVRTVISQGN